MATRFAVATGNYSNTAIWDNGAVPTSADDVYANNFTVTIDGTYTAQSIRNTATNTLVPNIATPAMTSNNTPSGTAFASSVYLTNAAFNAFNQDNFTSWWQSNIANTGVLGYQFPSGKVIKRYCIKGYSGTANNNPTSWTFQGSNDGTTYTTLETVTLYTMVSGGNYTSGVLANTTSYTYYRINILATTNVTLQPVVSEFEMTESTGTVFGGVASGQFIYANGGNLTCSASPAIYVGSTTPTLEMTLASPNTATFNGSILTVTNAASYNAIKLSGTGTLTCNGSYSSDIGNGSTKQVIYVTNTGTLNIVGNLNNTLSSSISASNALRVDSIATVNITGDVNSNSTSAAFSACCTLYLNANATINITGNVNGGVNPCIYATTGIINVTGNVIGGSVAAIANVTTAATISVIGTATASSTSPAILASFAYTTNTASGTLVKVSGNVINSTNNMAIIAPRVTIDTNTSSWLFQVSTGGNRTLYAAGVALGNPAIANVRFGTTYGASSELTGTLRVPTAANVLSGVLVDNTTGTLLMTPAQFWNYLIASGFTADSIGDRLQNAATVATVGGQIASYNI